MSGYKAVLKIIFGEVTVAYSEGTSGTLSSMYLVSPSLYLPAEHGSCLGQEVPLALLVHAQNSFSWKTGDAPQIKVVCI